MCGRLKRDAGQRALTLENPHRRAEEDKKREREGAARSLFESID